MVRNEIDVYSMILSIHDQQNNQCQPYNSYVNILELTSKNFPLLTYITEKGGILIYLLLDFGGEGDMLFLRE